MRGLLLVVAGAALSCSAMAAPARPGLTGMWDYRGRVQDRQEITAPPVTPAVAAKLEKRRVAREAGYVRNIANILCLPTGFPQMMQWKSPLSILETPGRVTILSEHDPGNDEPRTIYLDRPLPAEVDPSWNGYSVGNWEGDQLVVTTIGLHDRGILISGVPKTSTARVVERFRLIDGGKALIDELTITDPAVLTAPWRVAFRYDRMPQDSERLEAVCEPDIEALKAVDLASLREIDDEAARLLDPTLQYNPGAR